MTSAWQARVRERSAGISDAGRWRSIRHLDGSGPSFRLCDGREVISFASNDYLGLASHQAVRRGAVEAIERWGTGSGSARLLVGDRPVHHQLEIELAEWKGAEAALVFPTGFAANLGVLTTFATDGALIVSDELNHASIVDGCRLSRGDVAVSRHSEVVHVDELLANHDKSIVVTDSVFSMDGDVAPLDDLVEVCRDHGSLLVVDEAHAVLGPDWVPPEDVDVLRVGTLSKTLGSLGGLVVGPREFIDLIVNSARSFIFTTSPTPGDMGAALAAVRVVRSAEGGRLRDRLRSLVDRMAPGHPSPIIPVMFGDEQSALDASGRLLDDHGLLVPAIRPPTVPPGTARLRIALSAAHTDEQVGRLVTALEQL